MTWPVAPSMPCSLLLITTLLSPLLPEILPSLLPNPVVCAKHILPGRVWNLTSSNFEHDTQASTGATTGDWFVKFYAPWCGHCKALAPQWEKLAKELKKKVMVAQVDVTRNRMLGQRFGITGFPTLILFTKGKMYKYSGIRTAGKMKEFALGGYVQTNSENVPPELPSWEVFMFKILAVYEELREKSSAASLGFIAFIGACLAALSVLFHILLCNCMRSKKRVQVVPFELQDYWKFCTFSKTYPLIRSENTRKRRRKKMISLALYPCSVCNA